MYPPHHFSDSYASPDSESVHFKPPKQTPGPGFYKRSNHFRKLLLVGVGAAALVGLFCIVGGILIFKNKYTASSGIVVIPLSSDMVKGLLSLVLNLVVALCTDATGCVHGIALRSALASEKRLHFNTNLRLLRAASGWLNPNNKLWNFVMAILLILSYSSNVLVTLRIHRVSSSGIDDIPFAVGVSGVPLIVLGVALLLQAVIALACVWAAWTKILTWSSSPFDLTAALVHHAQIIPDPGRCMRSVSGSNQRGPVTPSPKQPSAWRAHPSIRKVVWTLWTLVALCFAWGLITTRLGNYDISYIIHSWSFLPQFDVALLSIGAPGVVMQGYWGFFYVCVAAIQGPLTLALHCSELIVNVMRDERMWRKATSKQGTTISSHPLAPVFKSPLNFGFLLAKPLLHWMFGHSFSWAGTAEDNALSFVGLLMWPVQIFNYTAALLIVSLFFTIIVFLRRKGPQPAAYGHIQTLANLIDEWSPTMWWGDKEGGLQFRHAGTSDHPLPEVDMNALYD